MTSATGKFDWQWNVAVCMSKWSPDRRTLVDMCLVCEAYGQECAWISTSQAASERWVRAHSRWHRDTPAPGKIVRQVRAEFPEWQS